MLKRRLKKAKNSLAVTVMAAALSSLSLLLIPFTVGLEGEGSSLAAYVIAAVFWIGLILTFVASISTKRILSGCCENLLREKAIKNQLPGAFSFSRNWQSLTLYAITGVGLLLIVTDILFSYVPELIMFPIISATIMAFALHCVVDGKYYKVYRLIKESVNNESKH